MFSLDGIAGTKSISNINVGTNLNNINGKSTGLKGPLLNLNSNFKNWSTLFLYHFGFYLSVIYP